jgi:hypothetical protein
MLQIIAQITWLGLVTECLSEVDLAKRRERVKTSLHHAAQWPLRTSESPYSMEASGKPALHASNDAVNPARLRFIGRTASVLSKDALSFTTSYKA